MQYLDPHYCYILTLESYSVCEDSTSTTANYVIQDTFKFSWKLHKSKTSDPDIATTNDFCVKPFTICDIYALEDIRLFLPNILKRNALQIFYVFSTWIRQIFTMISNFIKVNIRYCYSAIWVATFVILVDMTFVYTKGWIKRLLFFSFCLSYISASMH